MRSGSVLQLHWRQSIFLRKKDLRVGFSILGLCNVQVRSLALPSIVKKQMSGKWSWISHCHQDFVFRMFWDVFGCLKSSQAPFCCGWPSTCTWWKFRRLFFQNCQSQSFSALMLVHAGEYCNIAKSDAIGCPLIKAMAWFVFCLGWPMLINIRKKTVCFSPPVSTLACSWGLDSVVPLKFVIIQWNCWELLSMITQWWLQENTHIGIISILSILAIKSYQKIGIKLQFFFKFVCSEISSFPQDRWNVSVFFSNGWTLEVSSDGRTSLRVPSQGFVAIHHGAAKKASYWNDRIATTGYLGVLTYSRVFHLKTHQIILHNFIFW